MDFSSLLFDFENWGFYDFLIPFILFSAIIYGLLKKTHIFDTYDKTNNTYKNSPVNLIISLVSSFFITAYTDAGTTLASYITDTSQTVSYIIIGTLTFLFLGALAGFDFTKFEIGKNKKPITEIMGHLFFGLVIIILIIFIFYQFPIFQDTEATNLFWIIATIVILIVIYLLTKKPSKSNQTTNSTGSQNQSQGSQGSQNQGSKKTI